MSNGKGSKRRPKNVDYQVWSDNYDRIFRKKGHNDDRRDKGSDNNKKR